MVRGALERLYRDIVDVLAHIAVMGNDPQVPAMLAAQRLSVTVNAPGATA